MVAKIHRDLFWKSIQSFPPIVFNKEKITLVSSFMPPELQPLPEGMESLDSHIQSCPSQYHPLLFQGEDQLDQLTSSPEVGRETGKLESSSIQRLLRFL